MKALSIVGQAIAFLVCAIVVIVYVPLYIAFMVCYYVFGYTCMVVLFISGGLLVMLYKVAAALSRASRR